MPRSDDLSEEIVQLSQVAITQLRIVRTNFWDCRFIVGYRALTSTKHISVALVGCDIRTWQVGAQHDTLI